MCGPDCHENVWATETVYYPDLRREDIDPTVRHVIAHLFLAKPRQIYERSLRRVEGLARLLVLEKFANSDVRYTPDALSEGGPIPCGNTTSVTDAS
jgi:hypothetical protein